MSEDEENMNLPDKKVKEVAENAGIPVEDAKDGIETVMGMVKDPETIPDEEKEIATKMVGEAIQEKDDFEQAKKIVGATLSSVAGARKTGKISGEGLAAVAELGSKISKGSANKDDLQKLAQYGIGAFSGFSNARELTSDVYNAIEDVKKEEVINVENKEETEEKEE